MLNPRQALIHSFKVVPSLPDPLKPLLDIAYNLWWTWHPEAVELFQRLDREQWTRSHHNPVRMLGQISQSRLDEAAQDDGFLTSMQHVLQNLDRHMTRTPWLKKSGKDEQDFRIAYFCTEFGMTECLQIYSGGLGCLAGDHLKSAGELGVPLTGVGLLYRNGYFQQYLNADGWQQEYNPELDFANLPLERLYDESGEQVRVSIDLPSRPLQIALWKVIVGRVELILLDTNLSENQPDDRAITSQLYGGDMEMRIKQELVLGIGGLRALAAIGLEPDVCHMNEGHSAFLALERIGRLIDRHDLTFDQARETAAPGHVFTTHTPVPAGIDRFPPEMITRYFKPYIDRLRLDMEGLLALGRENVYDKKEFFSMAVLALRTSAWANGVSRLHGEVSRSMWKPVWPGLPENELPIGHVTNGVHARTWLSGDMIHLLDRYLGGRWQSDPADHAVWKNVTEIPDEEFWRVHERRRHSLILWARQRMREQLEARGATAGEIQSITDSLDPNALTIGFARRFATYKRGTLLFRDQQRLLKLLADAERPVQLLISGKAHPADGGGKDLIRQIVQFARESEAGHKIFFLENYDMGVARQLVQGCDVWLNTPRRGMEASGTSGMKAALNGVLNCSILDGWWDEAYTSEVGWAIGRGETYANPDHADEIEARALVELLENRIVPIFYDRDSFGVPRQWVKKMKTCIAQLAPTFNTNRMVQEYCEKYYLPARDRVQRFQKDRMAPARAIDDAKKRLRQAWPSLAIENVQARTHSPIDVRQPLDVCATVRLDGLEPDDVKVQLYVGRLDNDGCITDGRVVDCQRGKDLGDGRYEYQTRYHPDRSGRFGFSVRIVPGSELLDGFPEPGLILWETPGQAAAEAGATSAATSAA